MSMSANVVNLADVERLESHGVSPFHVPLGVREIGRVALDDIASDEIVDGDSVRFLCACVNDSIVLRNCPPYIRAWMMREGERS